MPIRKVHVNDHMRRKPEQQQRIHVDDYNRMQEVNPGRPPGREELGPRETEEPTDLEKVVVEIGDSVQLLGKNLKDEAPAESDEQLLEGIENYPEVLESYAFDVKELPNLHENPEDMKQVWGDTIGSKDDELHGKPSDKDPEIRLAEETEKKKQMQRNIESVARECAKKIRRGELDNDLVKINLEARDEARMHFGKETYDMVDKDPHGFKDQVNRYMKSDTSAHASEITYEPDGKVGVWYDDSDSQSDYFHHYTLSQKAAIEWVKKDGWDTMSGRMVNYDYDRAVKAHKFFDRLEKQTGKKVTRGRIHVHFDDVPDLEAARKMLPEARSKLRKIGQSPAIYVEEPGYGPKVYMVCSDNLEWRGWRKVE